jgi:hypothetical protein
MPTSINTLKTVTKTTLVVKVNQCLTTMEAAASEEEVDTIKTTVE